MNKHNGRNRRLQSFEDRYMALYGRDNWESTNMDLYAEFDPGEDAKVKATVQERMSRLLHTVEGQVLKETFLAEANTFQVDKNLSIEDLCQQRRGVYFDFSIPGRIHIVWNHMQTDGVGIFRPLRELFDANPPLIPYREVPVPPRLVPEIFAMPSVIRRIAWKGRLNEEARRGSPAFEAQRWAAPKLNALRKSLGNPPFNILMAALCVQDVFARHPEKRNLSVGITAYFPFLHSRNKYAVLLCKIGRGDLEKVCESLVKQTRSKLKTWGQVAIQFNAFNRLPQQWFSKITNYYRRQIDVLISSVPIANNGITIANMPAKILCYPRELTVPYYYLLIGTREWVDVSISTSLAAKLGSIEHRVPCV